MTSVKPAPTSLLLTGFGPFPGVADNPSARLVETLAASLPLPGFDLHHAVLPTEWHAVAETAPALLEATRPDIVVHFGVCSAASTIRIECTAVNATTPSEDAAGRHPRHPLIRPDGGAQLHTGLRTAELARALRERGFPALPSLSAGRYLCNFLYYQSLDWGARRKKAPLTLLVHIPPPEEASGFTSEARLHSAAERLLSMLIEQHRAAAPAPAPDVSAA